jgi:hypothetical protein
MIVQDDKKSLLRPTMSMIKAADTARIKFHTFKNPLRSVCCVTEVIPTVSRIRKR